MYWHSNLNRLAERYRRIRHALPRGTRFFDYVQRPTHYEEEAADALRDWRDNPRVCTISRRNLVLDWTRSVLPVEDELPTSIEVAIRINHITN